MGNSIWFLSRVDSLNLHWQEIQNDEVLPVTNNSQVANVLRQRGKEFIALEERLSPQQNQLGNELVRRIMREWHIHQGQDWTEVAGLSLGFLCEFDLFSHNEYSTDSFIAPQGFTAFVKAVLQIRSLFEEYAPSQVKHDFIENAPLQALEIVSSHYGASLGFIGEQKLQSQKTQSNPSGYVKRVLDTASFWKRYAIYTAKALKSRLNKSREKANIYAIYYHNFEFIFSTIQEKEFSLYTDLECRQRIACLKSRYAQHARKRIQPLHEQWKAIKDNPELNALFIIDGINCSLFFHEEIELQLNDWFPEYLSTSLALRQLFKELDITSVLVPFDGPAVARVVVLTARLREIPSFVVQHGLFTFHHLFDELRTADYALVVSEEDKAELNKLGLNNNVSVVGCLQRDQYLSLETHSAQRFRDTPLRFLVLTYSSNGLSVGNRSTWPAEYIQMIVDVFNSIVPQPHITLKPHPSEPLVKYQSAIAELQPRFSLEFASGWTMPSLLPQCDVLVTPVSTAIAEASALKKPTILFTLNGDIEPFWNRGGIIPSASDIEGIKNHIQRAIDDYEGFYDQYDWDIIGQRLGVTDDSVALRIAKKIREVNENRVL